MAASDAGTPPSGDVPAVAHAPDSNGYGTLIVDGLGRIHGCGAAVEALFGASPGRMIGRPISAFIVGILFDGNTPGETARQLAHLCADHDWRRFEALDAGGHGFPIETNVVRRMTDGQAVFVLNLRRPGAPSCP